MWTVVRRARGLAGLAKTGPSVNWPRLFSGELASKEFSLKGQ
jgi:hypothetical protein